MSAARERAGRRQDGSAGAAPGELLIGVDGGATKTVAWIVPRHAASDFAAIGRGHAGPSNPRAVGFAEAQAHVHQAVAAAFVDAGLPPQPALAAGLGLAGAGRADEQAHMRDWAARVQLARCVVVTDDAESVFAAGVPEQWGIALICGTGSLALGRNARGDTARAGGWGYLLGDESGAYGIARAGLRSAVRAADGRGPATTLLARFMAHLDAPTPADLVGRIYDPAMTGERLASLSTVVFAAAAEDDRARAVVEWACDDLATLVVTLARRLELLPESAPLVLAGGVLVHHAAVRSLLLERLGVMGFAPRVTRIVEEPTAGAIALARRALAEQEG